MIAAGEQVKPSNLSHEAATAQASAAAKMLNRGYLRIYSGQQPPDANTPVGDQGLLAELRFAKVAFSKPTNGIIISRKLMMKRGCFKGMATWFRTLMRDGETTVFDGSIGTSGCDMNLDDPMLRAGSTLEIELVYAVSE